MNIYILVAFTGLILAQVIKIIIDFYHNGVINWDKIIESGSFPSSHSSMVASLTMMVGLLEGWSSPLFGICVSFGIIVLYDAMGVRYETEKQARAIEKLSKKIKVDLSLEKLKEKVGHKPVEVVGGVILGIIVALGYYYFVI